VVIPAMVGVHGFSMTDFADFCFQLVRAHLLFCNLLTCAAIIFVLFPTTAALFKLVKCIQQHLFTQDFSSLYRLSAVQFDLLEQILQKESESEEVQLQLHHPLTYSDPASAASFALNLQKHVPAPSILPKFVLHA
jgi:hypothetical protein